MRHGVQQIGVTLALSLVPISGSAAQPVAAQPVAVVAPREGSFRSLTVVIAASLGFQPDGRECGLAGSIGRDPPAATCLFFAGGVDVSLLWRGRVGGALGVFSANGQAIQAMPAAPNRVSLPLLLDVRPLSFLVPAGDASYKGRLLTGLGIALGPSIEIVTTSIDSSVDPGLLLRLQAELPLHGQPRNGVSLRFAAHTLVAPRVGLNDNAVRSSPFVCTPEPCADSKQGVGAVFQAYFGFAYYP